MNDRVERMLRVMVGVCVVLSVTYFDVEGPVSPRVPVPRGVRPGVPVRPPVAKRPPMLPRFIDPARRRGIPIGLPEVEYLQKRWVQAGPVARALHRRPEVFESYVQYLTEPTVRERARGLQWREGVTLTGSGDSEVQYRQWFRRMRSSEPEVVQAVKDEPFRVLMSRRIAELSADQARAQVESVGTQYVNTVRQVRKKLGGKFVPREYLLHRIADGESIDDAELGQIAQAFGNPWFRNRWKSLVQQSSMKEMVAWERQQPVGIYARFNRVTSEVGDWWDALPPDKKELVFSRWMVEDPVMVDNLLSIAPVLSSDLEFRTFLTGPILDAPSVDPVRIAESYGVIGELAGTYGQSLTPWEKSYVLHRMMRPNGKIKRETLLFLQARQDPNFVALWQRAIGQLPVDQVAGDDSLSPQRLYPRYRKVIAEAAQVGISLAPHESEYLLHRWMLPDNFPDTQERNTFFTQALNDQDFRRMWGERVSGMSPEQVIIDESPVSLYNRYTPLVQDLDVLSDDLEGVNVRQAAKQYVFDHWLGAAPSFEEKQLFLQALKDSDFASVWAGTYAYRSPTEVYPLYKDFLNYAESKTIYPGYGDKQQALISFFEAPPAPGQEQEYFSAMINTIQARQTKELASMRERVTLPKRKREKRFVPVGRRKPILRREGEKPSVLGDIRRLWFGFR